MSARPATERDIPEIVRVINLAYRVEDFFIDGDRTKTQEIAALFADPNACFLVIDASDRGMLAAAVFVDLNDGRGHFAMLSVDPASQKKGLGRRLISAVEEYCVAAGCTALDIEIVNLREELPAYYAALGFVEGGMAPFPNRAKLRRDAHLVLMTKPLTRDAT